TALIWDVRHLASPAPLKAALTEQEAGELWKVLAAADARSAFEAIQKLGAAPEQACKMLARSMKPAGQGEKARNTQLIADLDSNQLPVGQKATQALERLGEAAEVPLQEALKDKPGLEVRKRVERILDKLTTGKPPSAAIVQALRGMEVLE